MEHADIVARSAANCAGAMREWGARSGHRTALTATLSAVDMGVGRSAPMNSACLLAPVDPEGTMADVVDWAEAFFGSGSGGPFQIWSAWPTPDLSDRGYRTFSPPGLVRAPGGSGPPAPPELSIAPARTAEDLADAGRLADEVFQSGAPDPDGLYCASILAEDLEIFLGRVDGRPVATSMAYVSDGLCGIYAVATAQDARGRGYGQALTWAATLHRADLAATLQASPMGLPIYRRMGYEQFGTFTVWSGLRPARRAPRG